MLELKNISKKFKDKEILSNFNLKVEENKILAIVGPSGGGKTTLLRMLAGLESIDSGEIIFNGENLPLNELEKRNLLVLNEPSSLRRERRSFLLWRISATSLAIASSELLLSCAK